MCGPVDYEIVILLRYNSYTMVSRSNFPKRFIWGAATAAHQVEGGLHNQWTEWELENAKSLSTRSPYQFSDLDSWKSVSREAKDPNNYVSGRGVDHYRKHEEDFEILKEMNLTGFRFGIEWSRVEPEQSRWDQAEIQYYKKYLAKLKQMGITPVVTLFHFTLPVWFAKMGGFEKRSNVKYFVRFAEKVIEELGPNLGYIVTINEPTVYVAQSYFLGDWPPNRTSKILGLRVLANLILAHKRIYRLAKRSNLPRRLKLSMAHHVTYFYPGDDAWLSGVSAGVASYFANNFTISRVRKQSDFLAINYYMAYRMFGYRPHNSELLNKNDLGWDMQPELLEDVLEDLWETYRLPIMITENGLADRDDSHRIDWLKSTIGAMNSSLSRGVKLIGYLHWSLLDNFEWDKGYWPKFGLVSVDRKTMQRTIRPSGRWYGRVVKRFL